MSNWRPEGWKNEHITPNTKEPIYPEYQVFEAGADAMVEALKNEGIPTGLKYTAYANDRKGYLAFIPDDD